MSIYYNNNNNNIVSNDSDSSSDSNINNQTIKTTSSKRSKNSQNLTTRLLLRSTLLGSMSSLSKHMNQRQPSPAQLLMPIIQQQQQQHHHQQQQQLQQQQQQYRTSLNVHSQSTQTLNGSKLNDLFDNQQSLRKITSNNPNKTMVKLQQSILSSSVSEEEEESIGKNGIDLSINNDRKVVYNPKNTEPITANHLTHLTNSNHNNHYKNNTDRLHHNEQHETTFNSNKMNDDQTYMTQTQTFLSYHQNNNDNHNNFSYDYNNHNDRMNSARLAFGTMSAMFSSPSILAFPASSAAMLHQHRDHQFHSRSNLSSRLCLSNDTINNSTLNISNNDNRNNFVRSNANNKKRPYNKHPLIEITRTRALSRAKLKQSSQVSALLSGFALVAMVEMDIQSPSTIPLPVLIFFITVTTMLVSVHMIALMISTCILPHIESMNAMQDLSLTLHANDNDIKEMNELINENNNNNNDTMPLLTVNNADHICNHHTTMKTATNVADQLMVDAQIYYGSTPHQKMSRYISIAWFFSTVIGIFLFMLELVAIVWVKFWDHNRDVIIQTPQQQINHNNGNINNNNNDDNENVDRQQWLNDGKLVAIIASLILIPVLLALIFFAHHFYRKLVLIKCELTQKFIDELQTMAVGLPAAENV